MTDVPGDSTTSSSISVGSTLTGSIETGGDHDWYRLELTAGQTVTVTLDGFGSSALEDPYIRIRDSAGNILWENDDGGAGRNSIVNFQASYTGVYYVDVAAWDDELGQYQYTGDYQLKVTSYTPPPVGTVDDFVEQLTNGYWEGERHRFDVAQGGSITVNLTPLTAEGQSLARHALGQWSAVIGISSLEVTTDAQITFADSDEGEDGLGAAYTTASWSNGITHSAAINISAGWLEFYGTGLNSYSYLTYLHEIGHALGLGHAGDYNDTAIFPYDALFENDAWPMTVMSYFAQDESSYFPSLGFSFGLVGTPMLADIVALSELYGLSTTARLGDTT